MSAGKIRERVCSAVKNPHKPPQPKCPSQGEFVRNGKRYVRLVGHDQVRDLIIPSEKPNVNEAYICPEDLKKLAATPTVEKL